MRNDDPDYVRSLERALEAAELEIKGLEGEIREQYKILAELQEQLAPTRMGEPCDSFCFWGAEMTKNEIDIIALKIAEEAYGAPIDDTAAEHFIDFAHRFLAAITEKAEPVFEIGFGWLKTKQGNVTPCPNGTLLYTHPPFEQPAVERCAAHPDAFPQAHRLALELECLLLSCQDNAAVSKWWDSAHEALEQWREFSAAAHPEPAPQEFSVEQRDKDWTVVKGADITNTCGWYEEYEGPWESTCGHAFIINEGTPAENGMKFCPFCGLPLIENKYVEDV